MGKIKHWVEPDFASKRKEIEDLLLGKYYVRIYWEGDEARIEFSTTETGKEKVVMWSSRASDPKSFAFVEGVVEGLKLAELKNY